MKYQIIHENGNLIAEAKRINDWYLLSQAQLCVDIGILHEIFFFKDGKIADINLIFDSEDKRLEKFYSTHKLIWVDDGVTGLKKKPIWIKK